MILTDLPKIIHILAGSRDKVSDEWSDNSYRYVQCYGATNDNSAPLVHQEKRTED